MQEYLNGNDLTDLEQVAAGEFDKDLEEAKDLLDRKLSEKLLKRIHKRIEAPKVPFMRTVWTHRWKVAAAAMIITLAGAAYYKFSRQEPQQQVLAAGKERKTVQLPDGSLIYLEPGSTLTYPEKFGEQDREVSLTGEAFFEVKHDAKHPFTVSSSLINTTVLGTSFNIEARGLKEAKVVVVTGAVQVQPANAAKGGSEEVVVTANKSAVYNKLTNELKMKDATDEARFFTQKLSGKFTYKGIPLEKVVNDLQWYYNANITIDENIKQCAFYGDFSTNDDLDQALKLIAITLNAKIKKDSSVNGYWIAGGGCQ